MKPEDSLTEELRRYSRGDREIAEAIVREVMPKLHELAASKLGQESRFAPFSPTELIHEVWLKSVGGGGWTFKNRNHFYAIAANAMRQVLVDAARRRLALSRGAGQTPAVLDEEQCKHNPAIPGPEQIVELGMIMEQLERKHPAAARVVDMHHIAGFSLEEIAELTELNHRQVRHLWDKGKKWLLRRLSD
jgi:RNA polymerase sigma factor (TIGR02999 family)